MLAGLVSANTKKLEEKMSVVNMAKNIKEIYPNDLVIYKVGAFYNSYGKDAYIYLYIYLTIK